MPAAALDPLLQATQELKADAETASMMYQDIKSKYGTESTTQAFVNIRDLLAHMQGNLSKAQQMVKTYIAMGRAPKGSQQMWAAARAAQRSAHAKAAQHVLGELVGEMILAGEDD